MKEKTIDDLVSLPSMVHRVGSIGYIEKLVIAELVLITQPKLVVETGVFHGDTTLFLAQLMRGNGLEPCRIVGFDLAEVTERLQAENLFKNYPSVELIGGSLPGTLKGFCAKERKIDFAIVDAGHQYADVKQELAILAPVMARGSYIFCHDYRPEDPQFMGLCKAVDEAAKKYKLKMIPMFPSRLRGEEVVWGAAVLAKV